MQVRFLLGPAGSGKTFRCLAEIRAALAASSEGPPLLLLAPKQATFQLERQLLAEDSLPGYTRLHILSFERLAGFVFDRLGQLWPELLSEEGRVMVLRALLGQRAAELQVFRASARWPGLAQELNAVLREFQRSGMHPERLEKLMAQMGRDALLGQKLHDLALLLHAYLDWLHHHQLQDADSLLDLAAATLRGQGSMMAHGEVPAPSASQSAIRPPPSAIGLGGLWLDGFSQMTAQERTLLAALLPHCQKATLAFCLEDEPVADLPWYSPWSLIGQTYRECRAEIEAGPNCDIKVQVLPRRAGHGRFAHQPALQHLETCWGAPRPYRQAWKVSSQDQRGTAAGAPVVAPPIRIVSCADPEAEATFAAREILRFVRDQQGRFRDVAVLVRQLDPYHEPLRRVFARYQIPCFVDRRESIAHHPLAELTRFALRTLAFGWKQLDWFGALKTGLVHANDAEIDWLENEALARGWKGAAWKQPLLLPGNESASQRIEQVRQRLLAPFVQLEQVLAPPDAGRSSPTGAKLAEALRNFWDALQVEERLTQWSDREITIRHTPQPKYDASSLAFSEDFAAASPLANSLHLTAWEQMLEWAKNLALAFPDSGEGRPLAEWLPIVEAGLAGLTVGIIPPALDQVLVGAIDRSRNPDLRRAFVLGLNELVFPASPPRPVLLTETERAALAAHGQVLGPDRRWQLGHERFYGYIACTRAREQLALTCARRDAEGKPLNQSLFLAHVQGLFPGLTVEEMPAVVELNDLQHASELIAPLLQAQGPRSEVQGQSARGLAHSTTLRDDDAPGKSEGFGVRPSSGASIRAGDTLDSTAVGPDPPLSALPHPQWQSLAALPVFASVLAKATALSEAARSACLSPEGAEKIYGRELRTSISALEDFAACPFKFFVRRGLRAEERQEFEVDHREKGSFQHELLKEFHSRLEAEGRRWRDLSPLEAGDRIRRIGQEILPLFREGLFLADARRRFAAERLIEGLEKLMGTLLVWMGQQYQFDPRAVEVTFGLEESGLPGWSLDLGGGHWLALRGRIDRVDLCRAPEAEGTLAVVIDYKATERRIDPIKLHHGLELQLLAYLGVLRHLANPQGHFEAARLLPAGVFYVNLRGAHRSGKTRAEALEAPAEERAMAYQHLGRFNGQFLRYFDQRGASKGDQFKYAKNQSGEFSKRGNEALDPQEFLQLLDQVETHLHRIGREIFGGKVKAEPYRQGNETACAYCDYRPVCRFDPWVERYRVLRRPSAGTFPLPHLAK